VDESAITGESAPSSAKPEATAPPSPAARGVLSDLIKVRITSNPGETSSTEMNLPLVEGAERQEDPE